MTDVVIFLPSEDSPSNGGRTGPLSYGKAWFQRVIRELEGRQISYRTIEGDNVTRENVVQAVKQENPNLVTGFSHGFPPVLVGDYSERQDKYPIVFAVPGRTELYGRVSLDNAGELEDTTAYFLACNCGRQLLPSAVDEGAKATAGYNDEYIWLVNSERRPENDERAKPFGEAGTKFVVALAEGATVGEARKRTIEKFNELIDRYSDMENLYSRETVKWLVWNRNHFKQFGNPETQPLEKRKVVRQAIVPPEVVEAGIGVSLLVLGYKEYKRRTAE